MFHDARVGVGKQRERERFATGIDRDVVTVGKVTGDQTAGRRVFDLVGDQLLERAIRRRLDCRRRGPDA